jgi:hypothetical protein
VKSYRAALDMLNIKAAPDDPDRTKAFDCTTEGKVLGIRFNTVSFTWSLPQAKLIMGLHDLAAGTSNHSLRELQSILGKLNNVSQLCPALKTLISEATFRHTLPKPVIPGKGPVI